MATAAKTADAGFDFDPDAVDTIDQSSLSDAGPAFPVIQWHYGDPRAKKAGGLDWMGGFFIAEDQNVDAGLLEAAGWEATTWTHNDGSETTGHWKRELGLSVIHLRRRWEVNDGSHRTSYPWSAYEAAKELGRPTSRLHTLCLVKGLEAAGPLTLTLKGMSAMHFEGTAKVAGALATFAKTVIRAANLASDASARKAGRAAGKRWPYRAFWLPIGAARDAKGEPVFVEAGSGRETKHLCLPAALGLPDKPESVDLKRFYIGGELLAKANELYAEAETEWAHAWDSFEPEESGGESKGSARSNGAEPESRRQAAPAPNEDVLEALGI